MLAGELYDALDPELVAARARARDLCQELKRTCGTGGTVADGVIELNGDLRDRVRQFLAQKAIVVKG